MLFSFPFLGGITSDVVEGSGNVGEVQDESVVEVYKAYKLLYFLFGFQGWPLCNPGNLDWVHFYFTIQNDKSEVFYASAFELTFVMSEEELVFLEDV